MTVDTFRSKTLLYRRCCGKYTTELSCSIYLISTKCFRKNGQEPLWKIGFFQYQLWEIFMDVIDNFFTMAYKLQSDRQQFRIMKMINVTLQFHSFLIEFLCWRQHSLQTSIGPTNIYDGYILNHFITKPIRNNKVDMIS